MNKMTAESATIFFLSPELCERDTGKVIDLPVVSWT